LHRREITRDLLLLVALELRERTAVLVPRVQQLAHAVGVRRDPRLELTPEPLEDRPASRHEGAALRREPRSGRLELRRLIGAEAERPADPRFPSLPAIPRGTTGIRWGLGGEQRRRED